MHCAGAAEPRTGGRGDSSTKEAEAGQKSCRTTLTSAGRSDPRNEHDTTFNESHCELPNLELGLRICGRISDPHEDRRQAASHKQPKPVKASFLMETLFWRGIAL